MITSTHTARYTPGFSRGIGRTFTIIISIGLAIQVNATQSSNPPSENKIGGPVSEWVVSGFQRWEDIEKAQLDRLPEEFADDARPFRSPFDDGRLDLHSVFVEANSRANNQYLAYASFSIASEDERDVFLLLGSDDFAVVFLNGELIGKQADRGSLHAYDTIWKVRLISGNNKFVMQIANVEGDWDWGVVARVEEAEEDAAAALLGIGPIFAEPLVSVGETVSLPSNLVRSGIPISGELIISGDEKAAPVTIADGRFFPPAGREGPMSFAMHVGDKTWTDTFYVGSPESLMKYATNVFSGMSSNSGRVAAQPYLKRIEDLLLPTRDAVDSTWDSGIIKRNAKRNMVWALSRLQAAAKRDGSGEGGLRDVTGLNLVPFESEIDGQTLYYRLYVPPSYQRGESPMPMIVVMHPVFTVERPFIDGVVVADYPNTESWVEAGRKLGVAVLWPGYRQRPYGHPLDQTHLDEVLNSVAANYHIDYSRVALYGECSAAIGATLAIAATPARYSGVLYLNPIFNRWRNRLDEKSDWKAYPAYARWLSERTPLRFAGESDIPVKILHDSDDPNHGGPIRDSIAFFDLGISRGRSPQFIRPKRGVGDWFNVVLMPHLEWLTKQIRADGPAEFRAQEADIDGPIATFFTEPFVVITPTGGSDLDRRRNKELTDAFVAAWQRTNYGECRLRQDVEVTDDELQNCNWVLIGSAESNLLWRQINDDLPIKINPSSVTLFEKIVPAENGCVQAWCPHPRDPKRRVLLLGSQSSSSADPGTMELSIDGWFDYAIWSHGSDDKSSLVSAGRY